MPEFLRAGGIQFNWNSTMSRVDGQLWRGIIKVDWGEKLDRETVYGQTQDGVPIGVTSGQYSVENFALTILAEYENQFTDYLAFEAPGVPPIGRGLPGNWGQTGFLYQLITDEPLQIAAEPIALTTGPMVATSRKQTVEQGTGKLAVEFGCWAQALTVNGKTMWTQALPTL
jgi:hypothetical protein